MRESEENERNRNESGSRDRGFDRGYERGRGRGRGMCIFFVSIRFGQVGFPIGLRIELL